MCVVFRRLSMWRCLHIVQLQCTLPAHSCFITELHDHLTVSPMALCCAFVHAQMKGMGDLAWPDLAAAMQPYEDCCVRGSVGGNPSEYSPLKDCTCFQGATDVFQSMLSGGLLMCGRVILGHLHEQGSHFRPSPGGTINIHHILRHPDNLRFLASGYSAILCYTLLPFKWGLISLLSSSGDAQAGALVGMAIFPTLGWSTQLQGMHVPF